MSEIIKTLHFPPTFCEMCSDYHAVVELKIIAFVILARNTWKIKLEIPRKQTRQIGGINMSITNLRQCGSLEFLIKHDNFEDHSGRFWSVVELELIKEGEK